LGARSALRKKKLQPCSQGGKGSQKGQTPIAPVQRIHLNSKRERKEGEGKKGEGYRWGPNPKPGDMTKK